MHPERVVTELGERLIAGAESEHADVGGTWAARAGGRGSGAVSGSRWQGNEQQRDKTEREARAKNTAKNSAENGAGETGAGKWTPARAYGPPENTTYSAGTSAPATVMTPARPKSPLRPGNIHSPVSDNSSKNTA